MEDSSLKQYLADSPPTVVKLEIKPHFDALSDKEKLYAHHIARASFIGTRIILRQVSSESEPIYDLILALYNSCSGNWAKVKEQTDVSDDDLKHFLEYAGQFLANGGNYKGFGDSKFIPRLPPAALESLASITPETKRRFEHAGGKDGPIYADAKDPAIMHLGFPEQGHMSTYYPASPNITKEEIEHISDTMATNGILPENTRLRKLKTNEFELLIASGIDNPPSADIDSKDGAMEIALDGKLQGKKLRLVYGDHREEMARIALHMKKAGLQAANETQKAMMDGYAKSFGTGSLNAFKECQKHWVKDIGPMVESNVGFIETYRDPAGVRAEWEGFAAMVNKERTRAFGKLVNSAPTMIPKLPWSKDFEKDKFEPPDFTSLEVLAFASSGIPAGINIPNYDDIRRDVGFKNVSLGNVLSAQSPNEPIPFIHPDDLEVYRENRDQAFEVQVGIHELLGHGTGKLLQETSPGTFNFPHDSPPISPITNSPIKTYYKPGQTWSSVFGALSSSYEECRAECVAMALSCDFSILSIFDLGDGTENIHGPAGDVLFAGYLSMARAGIAALEFWDPKSGKWGQAHMQARYSILRVFLAAGRDFVKLEYEQKEDGQLDRLCVRVDREKILSVGRPAVEAYLQKLHVYKCTADVGAGRKLYEDATRVDGFWADKVRPVVLSKKPPRKVFVQANTFEMGDGKVELKEYDTTLEGLIQSFAERESAD